MSFSSEIKDSLCVYTDENVCCKKALLYGMLFFARRFSTRSIELSSSNINVIRLAQALTEEQTGVIPTVTESEKGNGVLSLSGKKNVTAVLEYFGHSITEVSFSLNYANLENECCILAFLRGVYLSCGRMTDPEKGYHLEFTVSRMKAAAALEALLKNASYPPLVTLRSNSRVLYFKDSEQIEELLTGIGAVNGALSVMNTKVYKDLRNRVNRLTNCEAANIGKTVQASQIQIKAIKQIKAAGIFKNLPKELREVANLRQLNPDASLSEIGRMCEPPVSRSGVNHRLTRLAEIAKQIEKNEE